mmetsp:Transcript_35335/g.76681  ORF Transcript_35335/g.76681 Transcript_35335/m.76681 type:complete len:84 (+) Transcript_35335:94-345(+)
MGLIIAVYDVCISLACLVLSRVSIYRYLGAQQLAQQQNTHAAAAAAAYTLHDQQPMRTSLFCLLEQYEYKKVVGYLSISISCR